MLPAAAAALAAAVLLLPGGLLSLLAFPLLMLTAAFMFSAVAVTFTSFLLGPLALVAAAGAALAAVTGFGVLLAAQLAAFAAAAAVGTVVAAAVGSLLAASPSPPGPRGEFDFDDASGAVIDVVPLLPKTAAEELREEEATRRAERDLLRAFDERMTKRELERRRQAAAAEAAGAAAEAEGKEGE